MIVFGIMQADDVSSQPRADSANVAPEPPRCLADRTGFAQGVQGLVDGVEARAYLEHAEVRTEGEARLQRVAVLIMLRSEQKARLQQMVYVVRGSLEF